MTPRDVHHPEEPSDSEAEAAAPEASEEPERSPEQQTALEQAMEQRARGGMRGASMVVLERAGFEPSEAAAQIDRFDEICATVSGILPHDADSAVAARLDEMGIEYRRSLKRPIQELMNEATRMSAQGQLNTEIAAYFINSGLTKDEAAQLAKKVSTDVASARTQFNESKLKANNRAYFNIAGGALMLVVGLIMMSSGVETSGRRTPLGAVIGGIAMIGFGIKDLMNVDEQTFERRAREVLG